MNNISETHHTPSVNQHKSVLTGLEKYNEPAPPPYDMRNKVSAINYLQQNNSPQHGATYKVGRHPNLPADPKVPQHYNASAGEGISNAQVGKVTMTHNIPVAARQMDTPSMGKNSVSSAEHQLAALTQQLENEMRISSSPVPSRKAGEQMTDKPPPPYHGPHNTEPMSIAGYSQPINSTSIQLQHSPSPVSPTSSTGSNVSTPSSTKGLTTNLQTALPYQVTPPQAKGPSEAEKKLDALTQELENQMDEHPQGDYFGGYLPVRTMNQGILTV